MKRILVSALLTTMLFGFTTSYAWICTYRGPLGALYSQSGHGYGYDAARYNARAACLAGKVRGAGPCRFLGCR